MTTIKQALLDMIDNSTDEIAITPKNKAWVRDFIKDRSNEELELMLKDKGARSMAVWEDIIRKRSKEINPALASLVSLGVVKPVEEKTGSDRIMTLPSGRKVVLKDIDHDTLAELHHIKSAGVEAMKKAVATGFEASFSPELIRGTELMRNYLAGVDPQVLHDNTRTIMEEAVVDPIMSASDKLAARKVWDVVSTHFGSLSLGDAINPHDFELPTPTADQLRNESYLDPSERNHRYQLAVRRGQIRAALRKKGMDDGHIDRLFAALAENGVNLLNFNMDDLVISYSPSTPAVFDGALESFNKKAKKKAKKIKQ